MKKIIKILLLIIIGSSLFFINSNALDIDKMQEEIISTEEIYDLVTGDAKNILGDLKISANTNIETQSKNMYEKAKGYVKNVINDVTKSMIKIFVVLIISSIGLGFAMENDLKSINNYINIATVLSISSIVLLDVRSVLNLCAIAINEIDILSKGLMPAMVTATAIAGAPTTATVNYATSMFVFDLIITLISRFLFDFTYVYIAIVTVNAAIENDILIKLADFIKWATIGTLKIIITLFITYISITGVVAGSADAFAIKTTKFVVSGVVPVVGSIISDASETILVGANIIKNSVGIFGIFAVISICLVPIIYIILNFLMFKITAVIVSPISTKQITGLLDGISSSFNMALAMISSSAAIIFIMMVMSIILVRG